MKLASLIEIIKYFDLEDKIDIHNLTQLQIMYLIRRYYEEMSKQEDEDS